jgi:hypothetical protein
MTPAGSLTTGQASPSNSAGLLVIYLTCRAAGEAVRALGREYAVTTSGRVFDRLTMPVDDDAIIAGGAPTRGRGAFTTHEANFGASRSMALVMVNY